MGWATVSSSEQPHGFGFFHCWNFSKFSQYSLRYSAVNVNHGDGLSSSDVIVSAATEGKIRDIDFAIPQDGANLPDHSGHIAVPQIDKIPLQRRLHFDSVHMKQARGVLVQDCALDDVFLTISSYHNRKYAARPSG